MNIQQKTQGSASPSTNAPANIEVDPIIGAWASKAVFLSGYEGTVWSLWCFNQDHSLTISSSFDTRGSGVWRQNSDGSFAISLIEQIFINQVWAMSTNVYAPQVIFNSDTNSLSIPVDNPMQCIMHDPSGNVIGLATIASTATRIQLRAANTLPIQGAS